MGMLNTFDMDVEPGSEYLVTVGKTASSVKVEQVIAEPDDALIEENRILRELVRDMHKAFFRLDIDHCQACPRDTPNGPCTMFMVGGSEECSFEKDMRELGIKDGLWAKNWQTH